MNIVIFDFEVFSSDVLFGATVLSNGQKSLFQSWNLDEMKDFYKMHSSDVWTGWNIQHYDNHILQAIIEGKNEVQIKRINDEIISGQKKFLRLDLNFYDLIVNMASLKSIEAFLGKNISETEVDFNLGRKLTDEEKLKTESYNRDDLDQTEDIFYRLYSEFQLRLDIMSEFKLPKKALHVTGTQLAEMVLHAEHIDGIETWKVKPKLYPQLRLKNEKVLDFYLNEKFKKKENLVVEICDVEHKLGAGGIHGAKKKYSAKSALYFDVSGYYNLVMINYNLLPRSIPDEYKQFYKFMYEEQLRLKKINPQKRWAYKTILLSVFGAMTNKYCKFYDPYHGQLVTITGQIFLVDLLEKLEGKVDLIQSNTDGIIATPLPGISEQDIVEIINEWQTRTGFSLKLETIYDIYQRDVNCYMYKDDSGEIHTLGEATKCYNKLDKPFERSPFDAKEPLIVTHALVDYFMYNIKPEETIEKNKNNLRLYQYICKKRSFDWVEYECTNVKTKEVVIEKIQNINRAFALKSDEYVGVIYKRKREGKVTKTKVQNLPPSVFVYNSEILSDSTVKMIQNKIDYSYYILRSYERILEFKEGEDI